GLIPGASRAARAADVRAAGPTGRAAAAGGGRARPFVVADAQVITVIGEVSRDGRITDADRVRIGRVAGWNVTDRRLLDVLGVARVDVVAGAQGAGSEVTGPQLRRLQSRRVVVGSATSHDVSEAKQRRKHRQ